MLVPSRIAQVSARELEDAPKQRVYFVPTRFKAKVVFECRLQSEICGISHVVRVELLTCEVIGIAINLKPWGLTVVYT